MDFNKIQIRLECLKLANVNNPANITTPEIINKASAFEEFIVKSVLADNSEESKPAPKKKK